MCNTLHVFMKTNESFNADGEVTSKVQVFGPLFGTHGDKEKSYTHPESRPSLQPLLEIFKQ